MNKLCTFAVETRPYKQYAALLQIKQIHCNKTLILDCQYEITSIYIFPLTTSLNIFSNKTTL